MGAELWSRHTPAGALEMLGGPPLVPCFQVGGNNAISESVLRRHGNKSFWHFVEKITVVLIDRFSSDTTPPYC